MSKTLMLILLTAALVTFAGCKSEIDNKVAAEVNEPVVEKTEEAADEAGAAKAEDALDVYTVNVAESSIGWVGAKVTGDHTGGFNKWEGTISAKDGKVQKLEFTVDTASIFSDSDKLTEHLKSADFFDVEKFPEAKFVSTEVVEKPGVLKTEDGKEIKLTHTVTGNFTVRGVSKSVTFPVAIQTSDDSVKAQTQFTFKRFDFDIAYKGKADDLIRDEVLLKIALVAPTNVETAEAVVAE